jgi:hypothetical protein
MTPGLASHAKQLRLRLALALAPVNPIRLLVLVAMVNGIAAAPFLIVVMIISRNRPLMGEHRNGNLAAVLGWVTVALMTEPAPPAGRVIVTRSSVGTPGRPRLRDRQPSAPASGKPRESLTQAPGG